MKKFFSIIQAFFILIVSSCTISTKNSKQRTDLEKENLKGDVILIVEDHKKDGKLKNIIKLYNDIGNLETIFDDTFIEDFPIMTTFYYQNNKIQSSIKTGYKKEKFYVETFYNYDKTGSLTSSLSKSLTGTKAKKNIVYIVDENNNIISEKINDSELNVETNYYYSKNIKDSVVTRYSGVWNKIHVDYFIDGNLDRTYDKDLDSKEESTITYRYEYDAVGNWISQIYYLNGKKIDDKIRKIYYKGNDITSVIKPIDEFKKKMISANAPPNEASDSYKSNNNSQTTNSNSISNNQIQKQWVNCDRCHGSGLRDCNECGGKGEKKCSRCHGTGIWAWENNKTCYECGGKGIKQCNRCYGKGSSGNCFTCRGKGQVQE
jgi:YD repeat-containing protein